MSLMIEMILQKIQYKYMYYNLYDEFQREICFIYYEN